MKKLMALLILATVCSCHKKQETRKRPTPKVTTTVAVEKKIPIYIEAIGHSRAYNSAEIKAQVEGELMEVHFEQGQDVYEGDLLFTIDPRPYQAKLAQAEAILLENTAKLRFAKEKVRRYEPLVGNNFVSVLNYEKYLSDADFYDATILENQAEIDTAKINLDYCFIRAPFDGKVGKRLIDKGNLIVNDGSTMLIINQVEPIYVDFSIPEKDLFRVQEAERKKELEVQIEVPGVEKKIFEGRLLFVNNLIDKKTGMIPLRAESANSERLLWPGQFTKVKLIVKRVPNAVLIPVEAISSGQHGRYVYIVKNNIAEYRSVKLGETVGDYVQVLSGIKSHEIVITDGQINVQKNKPVEIIHHDSHPEIKL